MKGYRKILVKKLDLGNCAMCLASWTWLFARVFVQCRAVKGRDGMKFMIDDARDWDCEVLIIVHAFLPQSKTDLLVITCSAQCTKLDNLIQILKTRKSFQKKRAAQERCH